ncbi:MAG TPA: ATP-binding protein [Acidobacteriota bacterium]|nr:ATP-binding protein [Acidobacteriota bacterium]
MSLAKDFKNPYRPGAGHMPPYLAGREAETGEFERLLEQEVILENMILTGLRGVGKTVLLEKFKPIAIESEWLWVGTDISESVCIREENIAIRLITDLSIVTSNIEVEYEKISTLGFVEQPTKEKYPLNYTNLSKLFSQTPGLILDKLKTVLEYVWRCIEKSSIRGIVFAYDEAQNLSDHKEKEQFPLSVLLDVFQSIQRRDIPFLLILTGLPTLFPRLVETRTYSERMFRVVFLDRLNEEESREAILKPIEADSCPLIFVEESLRQVVDASKGYPYFIQFICREAFDSLIQKLHSDDRPTVPMLEIIRKLDSDFFAGRWAKATDRQRELLAVIASLDNSDEEFTVREAVEKSKEIAEKPFSAAHVHQMLNSLIDAGLVYKNRYGKYSFAVPLLDEFIRRQDQLSDLFSM